MWVKRCKWIRHLLSYAKHGFHEASFFRQVPFHHTKKPLFSLRDTNILAYFMQLDELLHTFYMELMQCTQPISESRFAFMFRIQTLLQCIFLSYVHVRCALLLLFLNNAMCELLSIIVAVIIFYIAMVWCTRHVKCIAVPIARGSMFDSTTSTTKCTLRCEMKHVLKPITSNQ